MSINSLANAAVARRSDSVQFSPAPVGLAEIAQAFHTSPQITIPGKAMQQKEPKEQKDLVEQKEKKSASAVDTALNVLFGYIPTEIVTLYVAVLSVLSTPAPNNSKVAVEKSVAGASNLIHSGVGQTTYWCFLIATPIVMWLSYAAKVKATSNHVPLAVKEWPVWEMIASIIAFAAWACAVPSNPFSNAEWFSPGFAGVIVLVSSTVLGLLAPFFQKEIKV